MKTNLTLLGAIWLSASLSFASDFVDNDLYRISDNDLYDLKSNFSRPDISNFNAYKKAFNEDLLFNGDLEKNFCLASGIEVKITVEAYQDLLGNYDLPKRLLGIIPTQEFRSYKFKENSEKVIQLRQVYGYACSDDFNGEQKQALRLSFLFPSKPISIMNNLYTLVAEPSELISSFPYLKSQIIQDQVDLVIRYKTPKNEGPHYVALLKNKNYYDLNYGSEIFLTEFTVDQERRVFSKRKK